MSANRRVSKILTENMPFAIYIFQYALTKTLQFGQWKLSRLTDKFQFNNLDRFRYFDRPDLNVPFRPFPYTFIDTL